MATGSSRRDCEPGKSNLKGKAREAGPTPDIEQVTLELVVATDEEAFAEMPRYDSGLRTAVRLIFSFQRRSS